MPEVCLVVPCFNEEQRLHVDAFLHFLEGHPDVVLCFVDDGSTDGTLRILEGVRARRPDQVVVLPLSPNGGKAEAVRQGMLRSASEGRGRFIGYWDADLSTPLDELDRLVEAFADPECLLVLGSRIKRLGSHIERRTVRHALGRLFSALASLVLGLPVYDSQCGAKVVRATAVPALFGEPFLTRWLFDLELVMRLRNTPGMETLKGATEVPLRTWIQVDGSKLRAGHMLGVPWELVRIRRHYARPGSAPASGQGQ
jgi:dolichyl-phosphate beta-glucosyltransferase